MRILLIEDEPTLAAQLVEGVTAAGYVADVAHNGIDAHFMGANEPYDAVVLDIGLPQLSGLDLLKWLRKKGGDLPVLILTARDTVADRVKGLDSGADDYLVKPFDLEELAARIRALLRRQGGRAVPLICHEGLILDPAAHAVTLDEQAVELSPREFAVLQALLENAGHVLSRERLEQSLYSWGNEVESNAVEVHIHHLRRKLGSSLIRTIRGVGYVIEKIKEPR